MYKKSRKVEKNTFSVPRQFTQKKHKKKEHEKHIVVVSDSSHTLRACDDFEINRGTRRKAPLDPETCSQRSTGD